MRSGQSNEMNEQKRKLFRVLRSHGNDKNTYYYSRSMNCPLCRHVMIKGYQISIFNYVVHTTSLVIIF